jgi:hypothetical protein
VAFFIETTSGVTGCNTVLSCPETLQKKEGAMPVGDYEKDEFTPEELVALGKAEKAEETSTETKTDETGTETSQEETASEESAEEKPRRPKTRPPKPSPRASLRLKKRRQRKGWAFG